MYKKFTPEPRLIPFTSMDDLKHYIYRNYIPPINMVEVFMLKDSSD